MKRFVVYIWCFFFLSLVPCLGQEDTLQLRDTNILGGKVVQGDTLPHVQLEPVVVFPRLVFKNRRHRRRYTKLVRDLKKVYPYAQLAKQKLDEMEAEFQAIETESERKKYVKSIEKELMDEFSGELKKLTVTQGRLLLKLIDRETGDTSYELLKELRGGVSAAFWQAIARLFGSNLKAEYDAHGEDYMIERIVIQIEHGLL